MATRLDNLAPAGLHLPCLTSREAQRDPRSLRSRHKFKPRSRIYPRCHVPQEHNWQESNIDFPKGSRSATGLPTPLEKDPYPAKLQSWASGRISSSEDTQALVTMVMHLWFFSTEELDSWTMYQVLRCQLRAPAHDSRAWPAWSYSDGHGKNQQTRHQTTTGIRSVHHSPPMSAVGALSPPQDPSCATCKCHW